MILSKFSRSLLLMLATSISWGLLASGDLYAGEGDAGYVIVTEKIPFADCQPNNKGGKTINENDVTTRQYKCTFEKTSTASAKLFMARGVQYIVFIGGLLAVLGIVIGGVLYSISGITDEGKVKAKKYLVASISGFLLLFFLGLILYLVAPWVYQLQ